MNYRVIIIFFSALLLQGCLSKLDVSTASKTTTTQLNATLLSVNVANDQLTITGSGFSPVTMIKIQSSGGGSSTLDITTKTDSTIVAQAGSALALMLDGAYNLVISSASAQASYPITFTLNNHSMPLTKLSDQYNSGTVSNGSVLQFNGTDWVPAAFSASQTYEGTWNAGTNTPNIGSGCSQGGEYYIVSTGGTYIGNTYVAGDWAMCNPTTLLWDRIDNTSNVVASFHGRTGAVVPSTGDYTWAQVTKTSSKLEDIADIDITSRANGDVLLWNSTSSKWVTSTFSSTPPAASVGTTQIANTSVTYAKLSLADGDIPQAKVNGLVSALSGKEPTLTAGSSTQYYRGDKTWQTLNTAAITESTNLYFTNARVLGLALTGLDTTLTGTISASDTVLNAFGKIQYQISNINSGSSAYVTKTTTSTVSGTIDARTGFVLVGTPGTLNDATPKSYVDTAVATKQASGNYLTALTGDVTASGPGSATATVAQVNGMTAANVSAGAALANAATNANTLSTIVKRDGSGNFSAGTITATLSGTATNVSGTVAVANGGTGATTLATNALLFGNGTSAVGALSVTSTPSVLLSVTSTGAPVWTTATAGYVLKGGASGVAFGTLNLSDSSSAGTASYIPYYNTANTLANSPVTVAGNYAGIGIATPIYPFHVQQSGSNPTDTAAAHFNSNTSISANNTYTIRSVYNKVAGKIAASRTNSGYVAGDYISVLRNNIVTSTPGSVDDSGTLTTQYGSAIIYGHDNQDSLATPITTTAYGLKINPMIKTGSIANMYDLFLATTDAGATVTDHFGVYQQDPAVKNMFAGNVGVGGTSAVYKLYVVGAGGSIVGQFSDGTASCSITPSTAGNISCSSDARLKKNIEFISDLTSLEKILKLQAVTYEWIDIDNGRHTGYIAQEVEKISPEFVHTGENGYKQVSYTGFIPLITGAIKEVNRKEVQNERAIASLNAKLESENASLREENAKIKARLDRIEKLLLKTH